MRKKTYEVVLPYSKRNIIFPRFPFLTHVSCSYPTATSSSLPEVEAMHRSILYLSAPIVGIVLWAVSFSGEPKATGRFRLPAKQNEEIMPGIVFVGAPIFDEKTDGGVGVYQGAYHWRDSYIYARSATYNRPERTMGPVRPGRNLYALVPARPDGKLTRLTHLTTGAVFKPS